MISHRAITNALQMPCTCYPIRVRIYVSFRSCECGLTNAEHDPVHQSHKAINHLRGKVEVHTHGDSAFCKAAEEASAASAPYATAIAHSPFACAIASATRERHRINQTFPKHHRFCESDAQAPSPEEEEDGDVSIGPATYTERLGIQADHG